MRGMYGRLYRDREPELVYLNRNGKFKAEKLCHDDGTLLIQFDGILLDRKKPQDEQERFSLLAGLYERFGARMAEQLRGAFNLVVFDRARRRVFLSNDSLGKRALYYCELDGELLYAESYYDLLTLLSEEGHAAQLDLEGLRAMVEEGELTGDLTYLRSVRYLDAYESLQIDLAQWKVERVSHEPETGIWTGTQEEALERFNTLFATAVERQFEKNREYGYRQYATLSGGMDSRACLLQAIKSGCAEDVVCVNYSQSGSVDQRVSQQIAFDHGLDLLYYPMDAAVFLGRLSESMDCNECQQSGFGATGAKTVETLLDTEPIGILHAGICGGELMGDMIETEEGGLRGKRMELRRRFGLKAGGRLCTHRRSYLDNLRACHNSSLMFAADCEMISPFLDEDVVAFVTRLDPEMLFWRSFYRKWMQTYLPNDYMTSFFYGPIDISPLRELTRKAAAYAVKKLTGVSRREMNPVDYWMSRRGELRERCEREYAEGLAELRRTGLPQEALAIIEAGWTPDWYQRFNVLTAIRAMRDLREKGIRLGCEEAE